MLTRWVLEPCEATRLGVSDEGPEVDGPGGEEEGEDVGSGERREDDKRVSEVERRDGEQQPERIEREEGPGVEARRPVPPPQQVHALHRLAVHLEPRHAGAAAARIGESAAETPPGLSDRVPMWIRERDDTGGDLGRVYRLGSARLNGVRSAAAGDGRDRRRAFSPLLLRCASLLLELEGVVSGFTVRIPTPI